MIMRKGERVMKVRNIILCVTAGCVVGCASINSDASSDRMKAFEKLETEEEITTALFESKYDDVHRAAIVKIGNQQTLEKVASSGKFSETVVCEALRQIKNQKFLAEIVKSQSTSERKSDMAVKGISDQQLLVDCARATRYDGVARNCIKKITGEPLLQTVVFTSGMPTETRLYALSKINSQAVLGHIAVKCPERWIQEHVIPRITEADTVRDLLANAVTPDDLKMVLLEKTKDSNVLCDLIENRDNSASLRKKALAKVESPDVFARLLKARPIFEEWVNDHAIKMVSDGRILCTVVIAIEFTEAARRAAFAKLNRTNDFARVFAEAQDELAVSLSFPRLERSYIHSPEGQSSLLRCFHLVSRPELANALFVQLEQKAIDTLYRRNDQVKIAKAMAVRPEANVLAQGRNSLFDGDVLLSMALGKYGENQLLTQWVLSLNPSEDILLEVALKAKDAVSRGQALARIRSESNVCRIAQGSSALALRLAAIERLTAKSEETLKTLARDNDTAVRSAAIKKMKAIGSSKTAELEQIAKEEQQKAVEAKRKKLLEQARMDYREKMSFESDVLRAAGSIQVSTMKKYLELKKKADINSPQFSFSGRVENAEGRNLRLRILTEDGEHHLSVELSAKCTPDLVKDEPVAVVGYDDDSTDSGYRLCKGEVRERGIAVR